MVPWVKIQGLIIIEKKNCTLKLLSRTPLGFQSAQNYSEFCPRDFMKCAKLYIWAIAYVGYSTLGKN